jgi:adenosylhomocysteine nucleosidase
MPSIILAIPQYNELKPLIDSFDKQGHPSNITQIGVMEGYTIPSMGILAAICGHGKTQFGIQVQYLIDRNPESKVIICIGAAGHLTNQCKLGDIVIGISTIEYDYKLRFIQADPPCHRGDNSLIEEFRKVTETDELLFKVHFGNIASGDEDIVDQTRAEEINRATNALCVAWEGSGGARAAAFNHLKYL